MRARVLGLSMVAVATAVVAASVDACRAPTQVILEIETTAVCTDLKGVRVFVGADAERTEAEAAKEFATGATDACTPTAGGRARVGTLVVTPGEAERGAVVVVAGFYRRAEDCAPPDYAGCIVARRVFSFVDYTSLNLPVVLDARCVDVPCNATSTCSDRQCVPSTVECTERGCGEPGVGPDGGVIVVDGGRPIPPEDGGPDAGEDASLDAGGGDAGADGATGSDAGKISGECGVSACPLTGTGPKLSCPPDPQMSCCYEGLFSIDGEPTSTCQTQSACAGSISVCCAGTDMCEQGRVCCSNSQTPITGTRIVCGFPQQCAQDGGSNTFLCRTPSFGASSECPFGLRCSGEAVFGPTGLFKCVSP